MGSYNKISYLVANPDYPIKAAGVSIDLCESGDCGDQCKYNASPGEILIVNLDTRKTVDAAGIATVKRFGIAQAQGKNGCTSSLKWLWHDNFNLCQHRFNVKVDSPDCGKQQIKDVWLGGCTTSAKTMGFGVWLDDSYVRSTNGYNTKLLYNWVVDNHKTGCVSCTDEAVCDELICELVDKINGQYQNDPTKVTHGMHANLCSRYQPIKALRLYPGVANSIKNFELAFEAAEACLDCAYVPAITGVNINGTPTLFTGTTDPSDPTRTMKSQLPRVVRLINEALKPIGGGAVMLSGLGSCCEPTIQVSTCATTFTLRSGVATISATNSSTPSASDPAVVKCRDCGDTPAPTALTCGVRLYVDQLEAPCDCKWPPNLPLPNTFIRTIEPDLLGDGAGSNYLVIQDIQKPVHPRGFGYYYQDMARRQTNGGEGGDWMYTNVHQGHLMQPEAGSRDANVEVLCTEKYCVWDFETIYSATPDMSNSPTYTQKSLARMIIRSKNATLIPDWQAILQAMKDRGICGDVEVECDVTFPEQS